MVKMSGLIKPVIIAFGLGVFTGTSVSYFNLDKNKSFYDRLYFGEKYACYVNSEPTAAEINNSIKSLEKLWERHYCVSQDSFDDSFSTGLNLHVDVTYRKIEQKKQVIY